MHLPLQNLTFEGSMSSIEIFSCFLNLNQTYFVDIFSFMFDPLYESICCMLASGLPWIDIDQSSVKNMKLHSFLH